MKRRPPKTGFTFLLLILVVGGMSLAAALSLLLLGAASENNGRNFMQSEQAIEVARSCAEYALSALVANPTYAGNQRITFATPSGTCDVLAIRGVGNGPRTICTVGTIATSTRRIEVRLARLYPSPVVSSFREVLSATSCAF